MTEQTDLEWIMNHIKSAETVDRLNTIALWIDADRWDNADYATPENLKLLRDTWDKRKKELSRANR